MSLRISNIIFFSSDAPQAERDMSQYTSRFLSLREQFIGCGNLMFIVALLFTSLNSFAGGKERLAEYASFLSSDTYAFTYELQTPSGDSTINMNGVQVKTISGLYQSVNSSEVIVQGDTVIAINDLMKNVVLTSNKGRSMPKTPMGDDVFKEVESISVIGVTSAEESYTIKTAKGEFTFIVTLLSGVVKSYSFEMNAADNSDQKTKYTATLADSKNIEFKKISDVINLESNHVTLTNSYQNYQLINYLSN